VDTPSLQLLSKLGSIVVHADEATSPGSHEFDRVDLRALIDDPDVQDWLKQMGPLVPRKR